MGTSIDQDEIIKFAISNPDEFFRDFQKYAIVLDYSDKYKNAQYADAILEKNARATSPGVLLKEMSSIAGKRYEKELVDKACFAMYLIKQPMEIRAC